MTLPCPVQSGMRQFLSTYAYGNASALQLVETLTGAMLEGAEELPPPAQVLKRDRSGLGLGLGLGVARSAPHCPQG